MIKLTQPAGTADTILVVSQDASLPETDGVITIGSENIVYKENYMGTLYGCLRGAFDSTPATHAIGDVVSIRDFNSNGVSAAPVQVTSSYGSSGSFQPVSADLNLDAGVGSADGTDPKFIAAGMFNALGADLTKDANYLGGVIGAYSITGTKATSYPAGAVLAQISDGVTDADGAVVAYVDGDSGVTLANAAFKAMQNNSNNSSGFTYGLDLYSPAHDGYNALSIKNADIRCSNQVCWLNGAGVPVDGTTGDNFAGIGSLYTDTTNGNLYIQTGLISNPVWKLVTRAE